MKEIANSVGDSMGIGGLATNSQAPCGQKAIGHGETASAAARFRELSVRWKAETKFLSNVSKRCMHSAYQRIIGIGEAAVPLILADLVAHGPDDWFWALTAITNENPIKEEDTGNMRAMTEAWLQWGAHMGYLNASPKTTSCDSPT